MLSALAPGGVVTGGNTPITRREPLWDGVFRLPGRENRGKVPPHIALGQSRLLSPGAGSMTDLLGRMIPRTARNLTSSALSFLPAHSLW